MSRLRVPVTQDDHIIGPENAAVTLVEYGDYECPHCGRAHQVVALLRTRFPGQLRFVFRHFPLEEIRPHARGAAAAAEAAGVQTDFWTMHEYLFEHQKALEPADLERYATEVGLDVGRFDRDRSSAEIARRIEGDIADGERNGVEGTPTLRE